MPSVVGCSVDTLPVDIKSADSSHVLPGGVDIKSADSSHVLTSCARVLILSLLTAAMYCPVVLLLDRALVMKLSK